MIPAGMENMHDLAYWRCGLQEDFKKLRHAKLTVDLLLLHARAFFQPASREFQNGFIVATKCTNSNPVEFG